MRSLACGAGAAASAVLAAPAALVLFAAAAPAASAASVGLLPAGGPAEADGGRSPQSFTIEDARITESSGLAASRAHPGVFWTHNDSDDGPYVYGVDSATGRTVATVTLGGISPRDVEAISVGPDGQVYVGDIGDNLGGSWSEVWIYRFPEPKELRDTTVTPVRHTVRYEDGPRNAESLMVHPKTGRVYIVSKNEKGGGLYAGPEKLSASGVNTFRRIAGVDLWATGGAFSPDGTRLVVRSYFEVRGYRWKDGAQRGPLQPVERPSLPMQRQGESVAFTPDGRALMYGTEGVRSRVTRVELHGQLLPDSAAAEDGGEPGKGDAGRGSGSDAAGADGEKDRNLMVGALTFGAAAALVMGLRKLTRRRG